LDNVHQEIDMISRMRFASITVTDIDQAMEFYAGKLGFHLQVEMPLPGNNKFVMVAPPSGGSSLVFSLPMPGQQHVPTSGISFETNDAAATFTELRAKGVEFSREPAKTPWGGVEAVFVDPFGNRFMLHQGGPQGYEAR
jgi:uncharacterized glyoxalase superfamily protein PhnB